MRGIRIIAGTSALVVAFGGAAWGARHEVAGGDPAGLTTERVWVDYADGDMAVGHQVDVHPPSGEDAPGPGDPFAPALIPLVEGALGMPADPSAWYVPSVEGPTTDAGPHLPDLVPLPAWGIFVGESIVSVGIPEFALATASEEDPYAGSRKALRFGVTVANRGRHSLELVGVPQQGEEGSAGMEARQCVRFAGPRVADAERTCADYQPVGFLRFDEQERHLHADGFTRYRLLRDAGGRPDDRPAGVVARSERAGFCLGDMMWLGDGHAVADSGWYRECRPPTRQAPGLRHGLSPRWADVVTPGAPGQYFPIEGLADGVYWIAITVNAPDVAVSVLEANRANNTSYRKVQLLKGGTEVKML